MRCERCLIPPVTTFFCDPLCFSLLSTCNVVADGLDSPLAALVTDATAAGVERHEEAADKTTTVHTLSRA